MDRAGHVSGEAMEVGTHPCPQCLARGGLSVNNRLVLREAEHMLTGRNTPVMECTHCDLYLSGVYTQDSQVIFDLPRGDTHGQAVRKIEEAPPL